MLFRRLLLLVLFCFAGVSLLQLGDPDRQPLLIGQARSTPTGYGTPNDDDWPPQRFTRNTAAFVHFTSQKRINVACDDYATADPKIQTEACSYGPPNELYMPNPCTFAASDAYARLLCHEIGHLNGWSYLHPL